MRIVLSLSSYLNLTGSEIYTYELAREFSKRDTSITILANQIGGEILKKTKKYKNIKVLPFFDHGEIQADLVISSQPTSTSYCLRFFPQAIHMQVLHSLFSFEEPVIDDRIKQYISVRPEIEQHWIAKYPAIKNRSSVIWNGVDINRFNENYEKHIHKVPIRLYIGTIDQLRQFVIQDLIRDAVKENARLWLVVPQNPFEKAGKLPPNVTVFPAKWEIENYIKQCDETAGIFVGRTTIEGFMMGKPSLVYDVDERGTILKKVTYSIPKNREIFNISYMVDRILEIYNKVRYD